MKLMPSVRGRLPSGDRRHAKTRLKYRDCFVVLFLAMILGVVFLQAADPKPVGTPLNWTTSDGIRLVGLYHAAQPGHRVWVLLHGLGSNKQEWLPFVHRLIQRGEGFLIYDARGHGDSTSSAQGAMSYQDFKTGGPGSQWDQMAGDLEGAIKNLSTHYKIDPKHIAVGGASLGANVALLYASEHPDVPALILLSPGLEYAGVASEKPFQRYGRRPVFIAASPGDLYAYDSVRNLILQRKDPNCRVASGEGAAHGVNMFKEPFTQKLLDWIKALPVL